MPAYISTFNNGLITNCIFVFAYNWFLRVFSNIGTTISNFYLENNGIMDKSTIYLL